MTRSAIVMLFGSLALVGCQKAQEPRSYDYFKAHPTERAEVVRKCRHGEGNHQYEPQAECSPAFNAQISAEREHDQRQRK